MKLIIWLISTLTFAFLSAILSQMLGVGVSLAFVIGLLFGCAGYLVSRSLNKLIDN